MRRARASSESWGADREPSLTRDEFARMVRDALGHLHDPVYLQAHRLTRLLPADVRARSPTLGRALAEALLLAVQAMRPQGGPGREASPSHEVLRLRFVEGLGAPAIQKKLAIGRSTYYAEQERALEATASYLWEWWLGDRREGPGLRKASAPLRQAPSSRLRHNLPAQLTSFVGREREMAEVRRLLRTTRLLTLTGTGGCGKTRLACQVAVQILEESPDSCLDGVWLVELAALSDPLLVPQAVGSALGILESSAEPVLESLTSYLVRRRCLLVLDNCEHLLDASASLSASLLRGCPDLKVLATSREALGIAGETRYRVPSLSLPDLLRAPQLSELAASESIRLFIERAQGVEPGFSLTEANASAVAAVCCRLDGIPLAIELAAALVRGLSVQQTLDRLDDRFRLLASGSRSALPRQQTLLGTLEWSHDLLSVQEKVLFRRLAVFSGGWTLEAAEAVCQGGEGAERIEQAEVLGLLLRLVDRSLVVAEKVAREERYYLLETIRQYALGRLAEAEELASTSRRHRDHFLAYAERSLSGIGRRDQWPGLVLLEREHDNLRAALDWSRGEPEGAACELRLALPLGSLWFHRGLGDEARAILPGLLARTRGLQSDTRADLLGWAGSIELMQGDPVGAREHFEESLALARATGNRRVAALALECLAGLADVLGRPDERRALLEEALQNARASGDQLAIAAILESLGDEPSRQGDGSAELHFEEAAALAQSLGDRWLYGMALLGLGRLMLTLGNLQRARHLMDQASASLGERAGMTGALGLHIARGDLALAEDDWETARALYRHVLVEARDRLARAHAATALGRLADLSTAEGRSRHAVTLWGALSGWYASVRMPVPYQRYHDRERDLAAARLALGEEAFYRAWAEGQAMTLEQAVEYALTEL